MMIVCDRHYNSSRRLDGTYRKGRLDEGWVRSFRVADIEDPALHQQCTRGRYSPSMFTPTERARVAQMLKIVTTGTHWVLGHRDDRWTVRLAGERQAVLAQLPEFPTQQHALDALVSIFGSGISFSPDQTVNLVRALTQLVWTTQALSQERERAYAESTPQRRVG